MRFRLFKQYKMKKRKLLKRIIIIGVVVLILFNVFVEVYTSNKTYNSVKAIPQNKVGLLLGTSKYLANGNQNLFYKYRINAAVKLFNSGKIKYIIVSGDNGSENYDEPTMFKNDLIKKGIPKNRIFLDYAGFRTLDSVVRSSKIFGQESITIISQQFHNERAIVIGKFKGIKAIGFNAKDVPGKNGFKVKLRELFARCKLLLDIVTFKSPKYLGDPITIPH